MKRCFKNIKNKLLIVLFVLVGFLPNAWAKTVAMVHAVRGNTFAIYEEKTWVLKPGDMIPDFAEVYTEEGAQITFSDYYDHKFHLSGSGHVKLLKGLVDLKSGYLWVQVLSPNRQSYVQTANARLSYKTGEGILSFDSVEGKTQFLSIKGNFSFGNILQEHMQVNVSEGHFSFISKDHEEGLPRNPTPIGFDSYNKITSLLQGVRPLSDNSKEQEQRLWDFRKLSAEKRVLNSSKEDVAREVASVEASESGKAGQKENLKGKLIYRKIKAPLAQMNFDLNHFYEGKIKKIKKREKIERAKRRREGPSGVVVKVYGSPYSSKSRVPASSKVKKSSRKPASFLKSPKIKMPLVINPQVVIKPAGDFESSLVDQYKRQMRHDEEVNRLIEDLQNYDKDYKQNY